MPASIVYQEAALLGILSIRRMVDENKEAFNYCQVQVHIQFSLTADKSTQSVENIKKMDVILDNVDVLDIPKVPSRVYVFSIFSDASGARHCGIPEHFYGMPHRTKSSVALYPLKSVLSANLCQQNYWSWFYPF